MITPEENIKTILADWLDALRRHDFATVERRMDPEVFWRGSARTSSAKTATRRWRCCANNSARNMGSKHSS
jgi:ketosteroid isomerase-like protein